MEDPSSSGSSSVIWCALSLAAAAAALLVALRLGAPLPDWLLPVKGRWRQQLLAGLACLGMLLALLALPGYWSLVLVACVVACAVILLVMTLIAFVSLWLAVTLGRGLYALVRSDQESHVRHKEA